MREQEQGDFKTLFRVEDDRVVCLLCNHYCKLKKSQIGICGVNQNVDGRLRNLVYGKPSAIHIDPIEKKPLYHFLPGSKTLSIGTVGCNLKCPFCQNWQLSQSKNIENFYMASPYDIVSFAIERRVETYRFTITMRLTIFWAHFGQRDYWPYLGHKKGGLLEEHLLFGKVKLAILGIPNGRFNFTGGLERGLTSEWL